MSITGYQFFAMFLYLPHTIRYCIALKKYPTMIMPTVHIAMKIPSNFGLTAFRNMITDGSESVVTPIIKDRTTPSCAPFASRASAIGIVPKISAYMGTPAIVARITPKGLPVPSTLTIKSSGIQSWINAPIPTPIST